MILLFKKKGFLRFLSAIETSNMITRLLLRAGLSIEYSEGFHPKPKISFLDTTATGVIDLALYVSVKLEDENIEVEPVKESIREHLPAGLELVNVYRSDVNLNSIVTGYQYTVFSKNVPDFKKEVQKHSGKRFLPINNVKNMQVILKKDIHVVEYIVERDKIFNPYLIDGIFLAVRRKALVGEKDLSYMLSLNGGTVYEGARS
jgi:radical SAM-linked protein